MAVTIKDIAREVGVAPSTVSRAIQDHPSISKETKDKVKQVMTELGYVPNIEARNLVKKGSNGIGVILPPLSTKEQRSNPFYLEILGAINQAANLHGMTVSIATGSTTEELLGNVQLMYQSKRVGGFIVLYIIEHDPVLTYLYQHKVPHTVVGQPYEHENETLYVDNDNQLIGKTATDFLVTKGHQKIIFVGQNDKEAVFQERYFGYQRSMRQQGLVSEAYMLLNEAADYLAFEEFLQVNQPTGIVAIDDIFALKVMQYLELLGYQVPDDLSVVSFNNSIFSQLTHPYLTTMDINVEDLGKTAFDLYYSEMKEPGKLKAKMIVPHSLIERESVRDLTK